MWHFNGLNDLQVFIFLKIIPTRGVNTFLVNSSVEKDWMLAVCHLGVKLSQSQIR